MSMHVACKNILVIKLSALGDFIQALGPMAAIRRHHPDAKVTLFTTKPFAPFAEACKYFDAVWIDERPKWYQPKHWLKLREKLNGGHFDRVYDLQNNDRTSFYLRLFKQKPEWVGAASGASHRNTSLQRTAGQAFDGHVQTLALAGITDIEIDNLSWVKADLSRFNLKDLFVLIVPGSTPTRPEKRWPVEHYCALCRKLSSLGYQPVLLGTEAEKDVTACIAQSCPEALDLTAQTSLFEIAALAKRAAAAIGNDTGPMHIISPTGCQTIVLFSKFSNPKRHAPKGKIVRALQKDNLADLSVDSVLNQLDLKSQPSELFSSSFSQ